MPQSLARILVHTVFSTKDRRPFLRDTALRQELHHYLGGILKHLDCQPIIVGGVEDHVHTKSHTTNGMCGIECREGDKRCNPFRVGRVRISLPG